MKTRGRIHSYEVGSAVDGPGLRFVVFTQGCPLRCRYCHNPDTRDPLKGQEIAVEAILQEMEKYHSYFDHGRGGLTVSGGEPLLQAEFVASLFEAAQSKKIHTALDTSGFASEHHLQMVLRHTDLVLLDIKSSDPLTYRNLTHVDLTPTLEALQTIEQYEKPFWVRFVLIPGVTDALSNLEGLAEICAPLRHLQRIEILPFHHLGAYKWKELGLDFELEQTPTPTADQINEAQNILRRVFDQHGRTIPVY